MGDKERKTENISAEHSQPSIQSWIHSQLSLDETHSPPSLCKTGPESYVWLLCQTIGLAAKTTKPQRSPRSPLAASWSEICSMSVSETKGWKAFFTVDLSSTKGAVAWVEMVSFYPVYWWKKWKQKKTSKPADWSAPQCTTEEESSWIGTIYGNIFSALDNSTRKKVAMRQESGFRWDDSLTVEFRSHQPHRLPGYPGTNGWMQLKHCWHGGLKSWQWTLDVPGGVSHVTWLPRYFLGESSEVNVRISKKPWGNL